MKKRNLMLSLLIGTSFFVSNAIPAFAYNLNGYKFIGGVSNLTYATAHASRNTKIKSAMEKAANSWNDANCGVSLKEGNNADIVFYYADDFSEEIDNPANVIAFTKYYVPSSSKINKWSQNAADPTGNWSKIHIIVNPTEYDGLGTTRNSNGLPTALAQQGTLAHEFGHAFGLKHPFTAHNVIMDKTSSGRTVYTPQSDDINGVKAKYGSKKLSSIADTTSTSADTTTSCAVNFSYIASEEECLNTYDTIDKLTNASNTIVQGTIEDTKTYFDKNGIYTDVKIKVADSLAGSLKCGDVITVSLHGGTLKGNAAKKFREETMIEDGYSITNDNISSNKVEEVTNGLDNFKKGDSSVFFLNYSNNKYYVTGSHQGRFKLTDSGVQVSDEFNKNSVQANELLDSNKLLDSVKNDNSDIKKTDFIKGIKNSLLNKKLK